MVRLKWYRKDGKVQSCIRGDTSFKIDIGIVTETPKLSGCVHRNSSDLFLESWSAAVFTTPGMWEALTLIPKCAEKNQRYRNKCIVTDPLQIESTTPWLSHLNSTPWPASIGPT